MNMTPVTSSTIKEHGYDIDTQTLRITFKAKSKNPESTWEYDNFPPIEYRRLSQALSPGGYYHEKIKGKYQGRKVAS